MYTDTPNKMTAGRRDADWGGLPLEAQRGSLDSLLNNRRPGLTAAGGGTARVSCARCGPRALLVPGGPCDGAGAADNGVAPTATFLRAFLLALVELGDLFTRIMPRINRSTELK